MELCWLSPGYTSGMSLLGSGSIHFAGRNAKRPASKGSSAAGVTCQKCLQVCCNLLTSSNILPARFCKVVHSARQPASCWH